MRKNLFVSLLICSFLLGFSHCQAQQKKLAKAGKITILCDGPEYRSDRNHLRVSDFAESPRLDIAQDMALSRAKAKMAGLIETTVRSVTESYLQEYLSAADAEVRSHFEQLTLTVTNQTLTGISILCQEVDRPDKKGPYRYFVAIELPGTRLLEETDKAMLEDARLKINYDYETFKKTFEKEMEKIENP